MFSKVTKLILSFLIVLSIPTLLFAQSTGVIIGKVMDENSAPMQFVTLNLRNSNDQKFVKNQVTDAKGNFKIDGVADGSYYVDVNFIGFKEVKTKTITIDATHRRIVINDISLTSGVKNLDEVAIVAKKPMYSNSIDRKVYDVSQDIMAKSGSATEVLANVPLVQVDIDGNVSLRNSSAMILINGKVSPLMGKNAATALQQLPANSIERIEVITNPSAKYKPDGTGGIINIVLKKNVKRGLNGTITGNIGNGERYNGNAILNYNPAKINIFGSYSIKQDYRLRTSYNNRTQNDIVNGGSLFYSDIAIQNSRPFSQTATFGLDFTPTTQTSFGLSGNYYLRNIKKHDLTTKLVKSASTTVQDYDRKRENFEEEKNLDGTFYIEHNFKKEDHKIRLEFNISHSPEVEDNHYSNIYRFPVGSNQLDNTLIKQTADEKHAAISYENPITEHSKFEAGYDGQYNRTDLDFYGENFSTAINAFLTDLNRTNRFIYNENIHAFYSTYALEGANLSAMFGLRGEYSDITSKLITTNTTVPNSYFKLYPSLHLTYKLNEKNEMQLNYSRRVRRPEADDLNPFAEYADPTNIRVGNPYLRPEIIHSIELGYKWGNEKFSVLPGIYYRYTYNRFTAITTPLDNNVLITKQENLSSDQAIGADLVFTARPTDQLNINFIPNAFYNQIDASNLGYSTKKSTVTWSANLNGTYTIPWGTAIQLNSNYRSARLTPQGKYLPSFVMNIGARQEVLKKKGSVYVTVSDIFKSQRQVAELKSIGLVQDVKQISNSRIAYIGMSYSFGKIKKKKDLQFDSGQ